MSSSWGSLVLAAHPQPVDGCVLHLYILRNVSSSCFHDVLVVFAIQIDLIIGLLKLSACALA